MKAGKIDVEELVRGDVRKLSPYVCARDLYKEAEVFMDANENAFGSTASLEGVDLTRYPDSDLNPLRDKLAEFVGGNEGITRRNIVVGNGSDEIIDLLVRTFAEKGENIVQAVPGYSMLNVCAGISGVQVREVNCDANLQPKAEEILEKVDAKTKMVALVSPNSPVGNIIEWQRIQKLLDESGVIVYVDEAYGEFARATLAPKVLEYENLVVSKTLSKAWGLAALRVGYAIGDERIIGNIRKIKPPYNVGSVSNKLALEALSRKGKMEEYVSQMEEEKKLLESALCAMGLEVFETVANFSVFRLPKQFDSKLVQKRIAAKGIIVRDRSALPFMENCIRITVGTRDENKRCLAALKEAMEK